MLTWASWLQNRVTCNQIQSHYHLYLVYETWNKKLICYSLKVRGQRLYYALHLVNNNIQICFCNDEYNLLSASR